MIRFEPAKPIAEEPKAAAAKPAAATKPAVAAAASSEEANPTADAPKPKKAVAQEKLPFPAGKS